jgi:hypothetical protein
MKVWQLVINEIRHRKLTFALGVVSVGVAVGCLAGSLTLLKTHDLYTQQTLAEKEAETKAQMDKLGEEMRVAMLKLGLNLLILPEHQNVGEWYAEDTGTAYMDEGYVDKLADSGIITVRHFLPCLQHRVKWPEKKRTIILVGTRGEVPNLHKAPREPLVQPVPKGTMVLGYELHQSLGLKVGDKATFMGKEFTVHRCHEERGNKDDITAWIDLEQAQEMLEKKGRINAIIALHCLCAGTDLSRVRADIARVLPGTKVLELGTERRLARAEARMSVANEAKASVERERTLRASLRRERERFASILVVVVIVASVIWIGFLAFNNVRERRSEIGIFRAVGFRSGQILSLFLSRAVIMGLLGGALGSVAGLLVGRGVGISLDQLSMNLVSARALFDPLQFALVLILAPFLSALASWLPAVIAAEQDPADILKEE